VKVGPPPYHFFEGTLDPKHLNANFKYTADLINYTKDNRYCFSNLRLPYWNPAAPNVWHSAQDETMRFLIRPPCDIDIIYASLFVRDADAVVAEGVKIEWLIGTIGSSYETGLAPVNGPSTTWTYLSMDTQKDNTKDIDVNSREVRLKKDSIYCLQCTIKSGVFTGSGADDQSRDVYLDLMLRTDRFESTPTATSPSDVTVEGVTGGEGAVTASATEGVSGRYKTLNDAKAEVIAPNGEDNIKAECYVSWNISTTGGPDASSKFRLPLVSSDAKTPIGDTTRPILERRQVRRVSGNVNSTDGVQIRASGTGSVNTGVFDAGGTSSDGAKVAVLSLPGMSTDTEIFDDIDGSDLDLSKAGAAPWDTPGNDYMVATYVNSATINANTRVYTIVWYT